MSLSGSILELKKVYLIKIEKTCPMKKRLLFCLLFTFIFSSFSSYSQDKKNAEENYLEYFKLPRETLFLHTNKTTFILGEKTRNYI